MAVVIDEVHGEIQSPERTSAGDAPSAPQEVAHDDLREKLERALRLMAERSARLCAD